MTTCVVVALTRLLAVDTVRSHGTKRLALGARESDALTRARHAVARVLVQTVASLRAVRAELPFRARFFAEDAL